ncbi:hypothetical protein HDU86_001929 [Geranomyces michiganensis]|nr:hypothetical protein HDU86_001929 [Geranomyces michiganensis]
MAASNITVVSFNATADSTLLNVTSITASAPSVSNVYGTTTRLVSERVLDIVDEFILDVYRYTKQVDINLPLDSIVTFATPNGLTGTLPAVNASSAEAKVPVLKNSLNFISQGSDQMVVDLLTALDNVIADDSALVFGMEGVIDSTHYVEEVADIYTTYQIMKDLVHGRNTADLDLFYSTATRDRIADASRRLFGKFVMTSWSSLNKHVAGLKSELDGATTQLREKICQKELELRDNILTVYYMAHLISMHILLEIGINGHCVTGTPVIGDNFLAQRSQDFDRFSAFEQGVLTRLIAPCAPDKPPAVCGVQDVPATDLGPSNGTHVSKRYWAQTGTQWADYRTLRVKFIPYTVDGVAFTCEEPVRTIMDSAVKEWSIYSGVQIVMVTQGPAEIRVTCIPDDGHHSVVGNDPGVNPGQSTSTMNLDFHRASSRGSWASTNPDDVRRVVR